MKKEDKEQVVADLAERLRTSETLLVADYRGLTMPQIGDLRHVQPAVVHEDRAFCSLEPALELGELGLLLFACDSH